MPSYPLFDLPESDWIILGDLNTALHFKPLPVYARPWLQWIHNDCVDIFCQKDPQQTNTYRLLTAFRRGEARTTIDYIFCSRHHIPLILHCDQQFLVTHWTDHALMNISLKTPRNQWGPGVWRFNTQLLDQEDFQDILLATRNAFFKSNKNSSSTIQQQGDRLKTLTKTCAIKYASLSNRDRHRKLKDLQQQRQYLLRIGRGDVLSTEHTKRIKEIESDIDKEITIDTDRLIVRTSTRWGEKGERSNKYFYRVLKQRERETALNCIRNPTTNEINYTPEEMLYEAGRFYTKLYTPTFPKPAMTQQLLEHVPRQSLTSTQQKALISLTNQDTLDDIIEHSPLRKSPGLDGLCFEVFKFVVKKHKAMADLLLKVMNEALQGIFPSSWKETKMVLLYKRGIVICWQTGDLYL
ncbi:hypothetical protein BC941DRAFT_475897 [Chlamydoabsidia padenii]|nr:hypothetical protein BC941DRAFT_475897 [Chlamydoabsidia padenii]